MDHLRLLGHALGEQGHYADAERTMRLAISLQPANPQLHEDLGSVLALQERFEEAVPCFEEAIRLEPQLPPAYKKLGKALAAMGRGREADAAFEEYLQAGRRQGAGRAGPGSSIRGSEGRGDCDLAQRDPQ